MKQTNNAIKFLMAQYRAIFKNANIAMLAAIAASALAAGQAQAAKPFTNTELGQLTGEEGTITIDGKGDGTSNAYQKLTLSGAVAQSSKLEGLTFLIQSGAATDNTIKGTGADAAAIVDLTGATITLDGSETKANINLAVGNADTNATTLKVSELNVVKGTLSTVASDSVKNSIEAVNINVGKETGGDADVTVGKSGSVLASGKLTINKNSTITIGDSATLTGGSIIVNDGKVNVSGANASAVFGSATSSIEIKSGTIVDAATGSGKIFGKNITLTNGLIHSANKLTIEAAKDGKFVANGGEIKITDEKAITFKGNAEIGDEVKITLDGTTSHAIEAAKDGKFVANGGEIKITDEKAITFKGNAEIGDEVKITLDGTTSHATNIVSDASQASKLSLSAKQYKVLTDGTQKGTISLSGAASSISSELNFTDAKVDLGPTASTGLGILTAGGQLGSGVTIAGTDTVAKISGNEGVFTAGDELDAQDKKLTLAFETLTVGSGDTVTLKSGAGLEVSKLLTVGSGAEKATLKVVKGGVTLNGAGSVAAKTINLEGAKNAADAKLDVTNGAWEVKDLSLTKGQATVAKDGQLTLTGTLLGKADSTMTVNGVLSTVGDGKLNFKDAAANSLKVETGGTLKVDAGDILNDKKELDTNALKAAALSGAGVVNIVAAKDYTMTQEEFKNFRDLLSGSFTGTFNMDFVKVEAPKEQVITTADIESQLATDAYNDKTLKTDAQGISGNYSVGNIYVDAESELNLKGDKAGLVLNNASKGPGAGYFVSKKSGSEVVAGGVVFDKAPTNLTLVGEGKIGTITSDSDKKGVVVIGIADDKAPKAGHVTVVAGSNIGTSATQGVSNVLLNEGSSLTVESGSVFTNNFNMQEGTSAKVTGDITTGALQVLGNSLTANKLIISDAGAAAKNTIAGGANVTLTELSLGNNNALLVGEDGTGVDGDLGSSAKVYTGSLKMSSTGSSIFVDPHYGTGAALFATDKITDTAGAEKVVGKVAVGKNAAFGVGFASMDDFEKTLSPYMVAGGFSETGPVKNALVLNKQITVATGNGIAVDESLTKADVGADELKLGAGSALIVTQEALAADGAVKFEGGSGKVTAAADKSSLVIFAADITKKDTGKQIFGSGTTVDKNLVGQAAGGLLDVAFNDNGTITLTSNDKRLGEMRQHISEPTTQLFADYRDGKFAGAVDSLGYKFVYESLTAPGDAYKAVDVAAHAATYAGAQQAAVAAVTTMADAMFGRVGAVGVEAATIAATGSQANGGVWLTPMYKSVDSDGFGAQGGSYGADVDLSGVAFGTDTVNGNMRFGAVFNIGSGDTEGKGLGNGLKDEFDYYGFGIYSAMGFGNFALVGDASMTVISHEVEGLGLKGKADTTAVTMGLTGQYTVATPMVDVTPHLGARFIRLNTDSYDLVSADGVLATTDFDVQNVFSVPLGVTLSKAFVAGGWTLAPSADLTIAFNTGDTEAKSSNQFTGIKAYEYSTEVLDEVQYGLTVGLGAQYGAFGTSFGINYTGSDNTDAFGVNAYEYSTEVLDEVQYGLTVGLGAQYGAFGTSFGINYTGSDNTDAFGVNAQCRYMF